MERFSLYRFILGPLDTNGYLIICNQTHHCAVIDAPSDMDKRALEKIGKEKLHLDGVFLTHSHQDHISCAASFKEQGFSLFIHADDLPNLKNPGSDGLPLIIPFKGTTSDHLVQDQQQIHIGKLLLEILHTPGHTPGGVCFYFPEEKLLFTGDTLFRESIGNLSFSTADPEDMWRSLKRIANLPKDVTVYPGHGEKTTIAQEQWIVNARTRYGL